MEPKTSHKIDEDSFSRLKNRISDFSLTKRERMFNPSYSTDIPNEVSVQLTYACNLRCKMCYQWGDEGYFKTLDNHKQKLEVDVDLYKKILKETEKVKSSFYIWGGEPLFHSDWDGITKAMESDPRYTTMCTNGLLIEKQMESLLRISPNLALLVSIDGLYDANNQMRGSKTFERLVKQLATLINEQKKGNYKGTISINTVLNDNLAPNIYEFMEFFEAMGVDSVYFNYPWYISEERAKEMDEFYRDNLQWLNNEISGSKMSWHSFNFKMSPDSIPIINNQILKLNQKVWTSRVRFQQQLEGEEISQFIADTYMPKRNCFAYSTRMEVLADGRVGTCCKFFSELSVGNIREHGLVELWKSEKFNKLRKIISQKILPVCSKCILFYRNGLEY